MPWIRWLDTTAPRWVVPPAASGDFTFFGVAGHTYTLRVQAVDHAGNAGAFSATKSTTVSGSASRTTQFAAAYTMGRGGELSALSSPPMSAPVWGGAYVRGFALRAQGGGYEVDFSGGVWPIGGAPDIAQSAYFPGWDIVRGIALNPDGNGGYVLDGFGGVWPFGNAAPVVTAGYFAGWDIAPRHRRAADLDGHQSGRLRHGRAGAASIRSARPPRSPRAATGRAGTSHAT